MKILNKLTNKHLIMNKRRTIVTIIGIILSTALMCGIGLLISTFREYSIRDTIKYSGDYFAKLNNFPIDKIDDIKNNKDISSYYIKDTEGYFVLSEDISKDYHYTNYGEIIFSDNNYLSTLKLKEGNYPKNKNEIVLTEKTSKYLKASVGDIITLNVGNLELEGELLKIDGYIPVEARLINDQKYQYKVVGILYRDQLQNEIWHDQGYAFVSNTNDTLSNVYIKSKSPKKVFDITESIKKDIGSNLEINYNDSLLALYGVSKYNNVMDSMTALMIIILGLLSVGCTIVIYNSFAISVMERKKQFGLFASIGATKSQLRYTVFYEAFIVGLIGIILGIISSFIGIGAVVYIMNELLTDVFEGDLILSVYPLFFIMPIIFMVFVIFFSAYSPARKASKASPIEVIRGNTDIKINKRKIKTSKFIKRIFGIEGEIALKNIKRNKKKYRITIISLVTSIVLFISFSSILNLMFDLDNFATGTNYDIYFHYTKSENSNDEEYNLAYKHIKQIIKNKEVKDYLLELDTNYYFSKNDSSISYSDEFTEILEANYGNSEEENDWTKFYNNHRGINVIKLDDKSYNKLKKDNNIKEDSPLLLNKFEAIIYNEDNRKMSNGKIYKEKITSISLCDTSNMVDNNNFENINFDKIKCNKSSIDNIKMIDKIPLGFSDRSSIDGMFIFVNEEMFNDIYNSLYINEKEYISGYTHREEQKAYSLYLDVDGYDEIDEYISKIKEDDISDEYYYENISKNMKQVMNLVFVIKLLFYGFISLVTLIGVTSVFNTLNTSIQLRKKEFAMLRSMGLTPKGFNRMITFESVFFGIKSLFIGLPLSIGIVYLISLATDSISSNGFVFPFKSILIAIIAVFIIVLMTMNYATKKIKHDNILEAIREENI